MRRPWKKSSFPKFEGDFLISEKSDELVGNPQLNAAAILLETNEKRFLEFAAVFLKNGQVQYEANGTVLLFSKEGWGCATRTSQDGGLKFFKKSWQQIGLRKKTKMRQLPIIFAVQETMTLNESSG